MYLVGLVPVACALWGVPLLASAQPDPWTVLAVWVNWLPVEPAQGAARGGEAA